FALREAIATRDAATLASVLANHGRRIDAAKMLLLSLDGRVLADARDDPAAGAGAGAGVGVGAGVSHGIGAGVGLSATGEGSRPYRALFAQAVRESTASG